MDRRPRCAVLFAGLLLVAAPCLAETATYRLTVVNTWSESTHLGLFPVDAHFSWIGGATHTASISFWDEGILATPGMTQMAEIGATTILVGEVQTEITAGTAGSLLSWQHWFCPSGTTNPSCGPLVVEFDVDDAFPLVTMVTMLGPSPDWFVGISGLEFHDGTDWVETVNVDLRPYDAGTRDQNVFDLGGPLTAPPDPISLITVASGQIIGPASLGMFQFERVTPGVPALGSVAACALVVALIAVGSLGLRRRPGPSSAAKPLPLGMVLRGHGLLLGVRAAAS